MDGNYSRFRKISRRPPPRNDHGAVLGPDVVSHPREIGPQPVGRDRVHGRFRANQLLALTYQMRYLWGIQSLNPSGARVADTDNRSPSKRPDNEIIEKVPVHIDSKGRLSVDVLDLAASKAFRTELGALVELAETHPPKTATL